MEILERVELLHALREANALMYFGLLILLCFIISTWIVGISKLIYPAARSDIKIHVRILWLEVCIAGILGLIGSLWYVYSRSGQAVQWDNWNIDGGLRLCWIIYHGATIAIAGVFSVGLGLFGIFSLKLVQLLKRPVQK